MDTRIKFDEEWAFFLAVGATLLLSQVQKFDKTDGPLRGDVQCLSVEI